MLVHYSIHELFARFTTKGRRNVCRIITWPLLVAHCEMSLVAHSVPTLQVTANWFMTSITILGYRPLDIWAKPRRKCFKFRPVDTTIFCMPLHFPCLEGRVRKVLRPATSTQVFLGFPVSMSKCWDGTQDAKLSLHASHVAPPRPKFSSKSCIYVN